MSDKYRWSNPAMTSVSPAPDDPRKQISMDAAGNKPPQDGLAAVKRRRSDSESGNTPEIILYGDRPGDE